MHDVLIIDTYIIKKGCSPSGRNAMHGFKKNRHRSTRNPGSRLGVQPRSLAGLVPGEPLDRVRLPVSTAGQVHAQKQLDGRWSGIVNPPSGNRIAVIGNDGEGTIHTCFAIARFECDFLRADTARRKRRVQLLQVQWTEQGKQPTLAR